MKVNTNMLHIYLSGITSVLSAEKLNCKLTVCFCAILLNITVYKDDSTHLQHFIDGFLVHGLLVVGWLVKGITEGT